MKILIAITVTPLITIALNASPISNGDYVTKSAIAIDNKNHTVTFVPSQAGAANITFASNASKNVSSPQKPVTIPSPLNASSDPLNFMNQNNIK